ncbi:NUDIX domain-containing protein [Emticicia sp.]|uniref:NUDIX hydrolase n=1 Tax=Emticicia sp. TaxID=1930953 RepID=UPI003752C247
MKIAGYSLIDKLAWIEIQNNTVLSTRSKNKHVYYFPGGKRELGESDVQALIREIREELSIDLQEESLAYIGTFEAQADGHQSGIIVRMTCYSGTYTGELKPASEIEELTWLSYSDKNKTSEVDQLIFNWLKSNDKL